MDSSKDVADVIGEVADSLNGVADVIRDVVDASGGVCDLMRSVNDLIQGVVDVSAGVDDASKGRRPRKRFAPSRKRLEKAPVRSFHHGPVRGATTSPDASFRNHRQKASMAGWVSAPCRRTIQKA